ncbi:exodeoxyribonuclease VII large subunit [Thiomicrorhabdus sp. ZW0627]|uniref:exodeoxyribonuclease VII large subunit n=1 Tax=Thiomicrorhabdus sp. ZW0627 TaxID=3039774 RepID=UPI002436B6F5|nr:exodeoxyribonuclease VII large subunit [Thiomicrorhabdus sp. ZW0627]MDG6772930.1 exodeoxyribonuclease VII large subunit [Thiomicrorhabdus sp. ZW0627]
MTFLDVPFKEKDQAKALGARWDSVSRKWYVPSELSEQLDQFERWLPIDQKTQPSSADTRQGDLLNEEEQKGTRLSIVLRNIQSALRRSFPGALWVIAEIANINRNRGHVYLELSETNEQGQTLASCRAMIWQSQAERLLNRFQLETGSELAVGQKVLLLGEVNFHEQYGFSFVIQDIDPSFTLGELEANLNSIRKQLISEKLYNLNKQLTLADDFFRIAVIAPPGAAGLGDFRADADALQQAGLCEFKYFYSAFQGEQVEPEMLAAFDAIQSLHSANPFEALVIIRGGGAKLDLNMLNLYPIARKICEAKLPVLTGIGHERDNTILDEVAHTRYDTPSKVIADVRQHIFQKAHQAKQNWIQIEQASRLKVRQLEHQLDQFDHLLQTNSQACLYYWKDKLEPLKYQLQRQGRQKLQATGDRLQQLHQHINATVIKQVDSVKMTLEQNQKTVLNEAQRSLEYQHDQIIQWIAFILSSGPKTQLNRGFVIAKSEQGEPIKTAKQAKETGRLNLQFIDGEIPAEISPDAEIKPNTN